MMSNHRFWIVFGLSLFLTLALGLVGAASIGSGFGDYLAVTILFPFSMLMTSLLELHFGYMVALALLQFSVYGIVLGRGSLHGHLARNAFALILVHVTAIGLVLLLAR